MVENKGPPNFILQFEIQALSLQDLLDIGLVVIDDSFFEVLIVEIVEVPRFLLDSVPKSVEDLDVLSIEVPQYCVGHDQIREDVAVFDYVDLIQGKVVVDDKDLAYLGGHRLLRSSTAVELV